MRKVFLLMLAAAMLALPVAATASTSAKGPKQATYQLEGALSAYTPSAGPGNGSITIIVTKANNAGQPFIGQTLTFAVTSSTHVSTKTKDGTIADGARASAGDLIVCTRNDHDVEAGEPERADLSLTAGQAVPEASQWIKDLAAGRRTFADRLAERQSLTVPSEDPDYGDLGRAFPPWRGVGKDAILQPPKPEIRPAARVLERVVDRDADMEAAD